MLYKLSKPILQIKIAYLTLNSLCTQPLLKVASQIFTNYYYY